MAILNKHKKIIIVISITLISAIVFAIIFAISWSVQKPIRIREQKMEEIDEQLKKCSQEDRTSFYEYIPEELTNDAIFLDFIVDKIQEIYDRHEMQQYGWFFVGEMLEEGLDEHIIIDAVIDGFQNLTSIEEALEVRDCFDYREEIYSRMPITKQTLMISSYIEEHGTRPLTTTPGEGYYADKKDKVDRNNHGLSGSPLYDSNSISYEGDFKIACSYGVRLNGYYQEESYSMTYYYFRDEMIDFPPSSGDLVWSGEYLFCFDKDGTLLHHAHLKNK